MAQKALRPGQQVVTEARTPFRFDEDGFARQVQTLELPQLREPVRRLARLQNALHSVGLLRLDFAAPASRNNSMDFRKLEGLSIKQLEDLEQAVRHRREQLIYQDRKRVRDLLVQVAADEGFSIYTLFDLPAPGGKSASPRNGRSASGE